LHIKSAFGRSEPYLCLACAFACFAILNKAQAQARQGEVGKAVYVQSQFSVERSAFELVLPDALNAKR